MSPPPATDLRSGFCSSNSTFYNKCPRIPLSPNPTTFISCRSHQGSTAFIDASDGRCLSYSDVWSSVDAVCSALSLQFGVLMGHVVLILSPNSISFPIVCISVMSLGTVITATNPLNTLNKISKQVRNSKPFLAFTTPELLPKISNSNPNFPIVLITDEKNPKSRTRSKVVATLQDLIKFRPSESILKERVAQNNTTSRLY